MHFDSDDLFVAKLTAYREAANQGSAGMMAVLCVIRNGCLKHNRSAYDECTFPFRYSSMNCPLKNPTAGDVAILGRFPRKAVTAEWSIWQQLDSLAKGILSGVTQDITNGATLYYADSIAAPVWALDSSKTVFTVQIGAHKFYKEY